MQYCTALQRNFNTFYQSLPADTTQSMAISFAASFAISYVGYHFVPLAIAAGSISALSSLIYALTKPIFAKFAERNTLNGFQQVLRMSTVYVLTGLVVQTFIPYKIDLIEHLILSTIIMFARQANEGRQLRFSLDRTQIFF